MIDLSMQLEVANIIKKKKRPPKNLVTVSTVSAI